MNQKQSSTLQSIYRYALPLLVAIITILVYMPSWHYDFQFDDVANIQKHFNLRHYTFFDLFFTGSRWISYWLNAIHYSIGKLDPFSYRVGNIIIHVSNGLLVFLLIWFALARIKKNNFFKQHDFSIALVTSTLFLLHPVQTQTVSYVIQGELEGLAALFSLAAACMFLWYANAQTMVMRAVSVFGIYLISFFACGTKEITIVLPCLLMLIDWWFVAQGSWKEFKERLWLHATIFALIFGTYVYLLKPKFFYDLFGLKMAVKNNIGNVLTQNVTTKITPGYFFISQFKVILHYLWIFIWPFNMSVEYDWKLSESFFASDCLVPLLILLSLAALIVRGLKKNPTNPICFGALWFAACIAPRSSFMPSAELLVDYKTYLASVGWLFIIAVALIHFLIHCMHKYQCAPAKQIYVHALSMFLFTASLGYCTMQRNVVWSSGFEFWGDIIKHAPGKARAYNNYGVEYAKDSEEFRKAIPYFKKAMAMDRHYSDPCNNLAVVYAKANDYASAIEVMTQSLRINPHYPEGYNNLASMLIENKEYDKAKAALHRALVYRPHYGKALYNLGRIYTAEEDHVTAWEYYKKCCTQGDLDNEGGFNIYAQTSFALKKYDDAIFAYKKVIECNPNNDVALFRLGNAHFHLNNFSEALAWYTRAERNSPNASNVLFNIAETYMRLEQPTKALAYFQRAKQTGDDIPTLDKRLADCSRVLQATAVSA